MTFFYFLRLLGDLSLFYAVANAFLCMTSCDVTFVPLIVLALCGALSFFLFQKKEPLRFIPFILIPAAFIGVQDTVTGFIVLASAVYVAICVIRKVFVVDYDDRLSFLSLAVKLLLACILPMLLFIWDRELPRFVPFVLILMVSTFLLTQALRHDPRVFTQRHFRFTSLLIAVCILAVVLLISSPEFLKLVSLIPGLVYNWIIAPILMLFAYILGGLIYFVIKPIMEMVSPHIGSNLDQMSNLFGSQDSFLEGMEDFVNTPNTSVMEVIKTILTIVVVVAVVIFLAKLIGRGYHRFRYTSAKESRTRITETHREREAPPLDLFPPADTRKAVRYYYRKFLRICLRMGYPLDDSDNSAIIEQNAKRMFRPESFSSLSSVRKIYIKARYSEHKVTESDVNQIKQDCDVLRKECDQMEKRT